MRCRPGIVTNAEFAKVPDLRCTADALHRVRDTSDHARQAYSFSRRLFARSITTTHKKNSPPAIRGRRSAERRMPTMCRATSANVAACQLQAMLPATRNQAGVTRPLLSQSSDSTSRLGRSAEGNDAQNRPGAGCKPARRHRTRSASESALAKASLDERDKVVRTPSVTFVNCVSFFGTISPITCIFVIIYSRLIA
jgi:hypothetical protein